MAVEVTARSGKIEEVALGQLFNQHVLVLSVGRNKGCETRAYAQAVGCTNRRCTAHLLHHLLLQAEGILAARPGANGHELVAAAKFQKLLVEGVDEVAAALLVLKHTHEARAEMLFLLTRASDLARVRLHAGSTTQRTQKGGTL